MKRLRILYLFYRERGEKDCEKVGKAMYKNQYNFVLFLDSFFTKNSLQTDETNKIDKNQKGIGYFV